MADSVEQESEAKSASSGIGQKILILIGILLAASLPFAPWVSRGMSQSSVENAVKEAGGRASYGKYLLESGDYFRDERSRQR